MYADELVKWGIHIMELAGGFAVLFTVLLCVNGSRLQKQLDADYGPRRHDKGRKSQHKRG